MVEIVAWDFLLQNPQICKKKFNLEVGLDHLK